MLARAALRTTLVSSARCTRYSVPRCRAVVRFMSTIDSAPELPSTAAVPPSSEPSTSQLTVQDVKTLEEQNSHALAGDASETTDETLEQDEASEEGKFTNDELVEEETDTLSLEGLTEEQLAAMPITGRSLIDPLQHPRTHGIPVAVIHLRSYHTGFLDLFTRFCAHAASALAIPISHPTPLPVKRNMWTVIKSPFAHKKSQENFERKTYKRVIKAWDADYEVVNHWVMYLEKNMMAGVGMRAVKWERAPVAVGRKVFGAVAEAVDPNFHKPTNRDKIKTLSAKIVQQELASAADASVIESPPVKESPKSAASAQTPKAANDDKSTQSTKKAQ